MSGALDIGGQAPEPEGMFGNDTGMETKLLIAGTGGGARETPNPLVRK